MQTELNFWLSTSAKQRRTPFSWPPPGHQDLSSRHDWPAKKAIIGLPVRLVGNLRRISGNSLSPLGARYKDIDAASQTLLIWVRLYLRRLLTLADEAPLFRLHQPHFHITKYDFSACQFMTVYRLNM